MVLLKMPSKNPPAAPRGGISRWLRDTAMTIALMFAGQAASSGQEIEGASHGRAADGIVPSTMMPAPGEPITLQAYAPLITRLPPVDAPAANPPVLGGNAAAGLMPPPAYIAPGEAAPNAIAVPPMVTSDVRGGREVEQLALLPPSADGPIFFANPRDPGVPYDALAEEGADVGAPVVPPGFKNGMWQFTTFRKTFLLPGPRATGLGIESFLLQTTIALPFFTREKPIFITPYFQAHILQGPVPVDLPPQLYDVSLEFRILRQLNPKWGMDLALAPTILSDFQNMTHQAYRLTGRGVFLYTWTERTQIAGGVTVTGREDVPILPVGGLIWTPGPNWRSEIVFPRPRILRRLSTNDRAAWWTYTAGEFGGNSYAIERASGANDIATYRDLRFELGIERKTPAGAYNRFEVGYVFDRDIEYLSGSPSFAPSSTVMLRGEATF